MTKNYEYTEKIEATEEIQEIKVENLVNPNEGRLANWVIYYAIITNAISMMSIDIHLPVLHVIARDLNTSYFNTQLILIIFYTVGILARIVLGPLSDAYGRRRVMLFALDIQIIGQAMQAFTPNIEMLLLGRVIQALASGGLTILISAVISDLFVGKERTRMLSLNEFVQPLSFVVAPIIGGIIANYYGWRGGFVFLLINLIVARVVMSFSMVETNFSLKKPSFAVMLHDYKVIMRNKDFMSHNLIMAFIVSAYMLYTVVSNYIYVHKFGFSITEFSIFQSLPLLCQAFIAFSYTKLNIKLDNMIKFGVIAMLLAGFESVLILFNIVPYTPHSLLLNIIVMCLALGLVFPACMKKALDKFPESKGTASSTIVVTRGILSGITMLISGLLREYDIVLFLGIAIAAILTLLSWLYSKKNHIEDLAV
ncbi:MAG: transporter [Rickettsiaceae bacterium]|jgi:DHA1 family bicyclomycin/chloramphenicol resistance-like MFS transporter|nr:transporter [Rickettsiaceae bacterium]